MSTFSQKYFIPILAIVFILSSGCAVNKVVVNKALRDLHSTVTQTIHVSNDNYDVLYVKPAKGQTESTIKGLFARANKNVKSIEVNTCFSAAKPYHPIAQTILPNGTRLTLTSPRPSNI